MTEDEKWAEEFVAKWSQRLRHFFWHPLTIFIGVPAILALVFWLIWPLFRNEDVALKVVKIVFWLYVPVMVWKVNEARQQHRLGILVLLVPVWLVGVALVIAALYFGGAMLINPLPDDIGRQRFAAFLLISAGLCGGFSIARSIRATWQQFRKKDEALVEPKH